MSYSVLLHHGEEAETLFYNWKRAELFYFFRYGFIFEFNQLSDDFLVSQIYVTCYRTENGKFI